MGASLLSLFLLALNPSRVVINEVMANPRGGAGSHYPEDRNEYVELYNRSDDTVDLRGWRLTDLDALDTLCAWTDTTLRLRYPHVRLNDTRLSPHSYAVVLDPEYTDTLAQGGWIQPYRFGDLTLILRPGNTNIGNELANDDPLVLFSPDSQEVSSFGTPADAEDRFPRPTKDTVSWERVSPCAEDCDTNWQACPDSSGGTPGRPNAIAHWRNLTCERVLCYPLTFRPGVAETIAVAVANTGRDTVRDWTVIVFDDRNKDGEALRDERIAELNGRLLSRGERETLITLWSGIEPGAHLVSARVVCAGDRDKSDDLACISVNFGAGENFFTLQSERFGPNLRTGPESLVIAYSLPNAEGELVITAYDLSGRERSVVFKGKPAARNGLVVWQGREPKGTFLPNGLYVLFLSYKSGRSVIQEKRAVTFWRRGD